MAQWHMIKFKQCMLKSFLMCLQIILWIHRNFYNIPHSKHFQGLISFQRFTNFFQQFLLDTLSLDYVMWAWIVLSESFRYFAQSLVPYFWKCVTVHPPKHFIIAGWLHVVVNNFNAKVWNLFPLWPAQWVNSWSIASSQTPMCKYTQRHLLMCTKDQIVR